jgi:hypothetical protein
MGMSYDSTNDTLEHINKVQARVEEVTNNLIVRASRHDMSKLAEPEKSGYDKLTFRLRDVVYGSDEYRAALDEARPVIEHHYAVNSHHPEHYGPLGINGMSLLDVLEMLCDWKAASERTKQGSIEQSMTHNAQRFGIDPQLGMILANTIKELGW